MPAPEQGRARTWFGLGVAAVAVAAASWASDAWLNLPVSGAWLSPTLVVTHSGSQTWVPWFLIAALLLGSADRPLAGASRWTATLQLLAALLVVLPLAAWLNEALLKENLPEPRPSQQALHEAGHLDDLDAFFHLPRNERRALLAPLVQSDRLEAVASQLQIDARVLRQWTHEVSSTFPSGHAFNAFLAATLFAGLAPAAGRWRRRVTHALIVWAALVSWSRVLLDLHRPVDVSVGALLGIVLGGMVLAVLRRLWRNGPARSGSSKQADA